MMKLPHECASLAEVRAEIDALDHQIIERLGKRFEYVKAAARFKTSVATVRAPERQQAMLAQRRQWAVENGLSPEVIENMYRELVEYFVAEEVKSWQSQTAL